MNQNTSDRAAIGSNRLILDPLLYECGLCLTVTQACSVKGLSPIVFGNTWSREIEGSGIRTAGTVGGLSTTLYDCY